MDTNQMTWHQLWEAAPTPLIMPSSRPQRVWAPPAGRRPVSQPVARVQASPDNHHMRRVRQRSGNGFHF